MDNGKSDAIASLLVLIFAGIIWVCCADRDPKECADRCRRVNAVASAIVSYECVCFYGREPAP